MAVERKATGLIGLLAGASISLAIVFLYARNAGKGIRSSSRENSGNTKDKAEVIVEEAVKRARKVIEDAKLGGAWW